MQQLLSLKEIFAGKVFRIPDYQRGYAWQTREASNDKNHQLEDFWEDLLNLQDEHIHYTGVITVERAKPSHCLGWREEGRAFDANNWQTDGEFLELSFAGQKFQPFYVVDGQQRLLTITIFLAAICEHPNFAEDRAEIERN